MARAVTAWVGKTDESMPPPRVRLRIFQRHNGTCYRSGIKIAPGMPWQLDHIVAIINGGANTESNLAPILTDKHKEKTAEDVAIKAKTDAMAKKAAGIAPKKQPIQSRGFAPKPKREKLAFPARTHDAFGRPL